MNIKLIFVLVLAGLAVLFIVQNVTAVEVRFLLWSVEMSRSLLIFLLLFLNTLSATLLGFFVGPLRTTRRRSWCTATQRAATFRPAGSTRRS